MDPCLDFGFITEVYVALVREFMASGHGEQCEGTFMGYLDGLRKLVSPFISLKYSPIKSPRNKL